MRWLLVGSVAVAALATAGFGVSAILGKRQPTRTEVAADDRVTRDLRHLGVGARDVTVLNLSGEPVLWGALSGRPRAVFFGFTHCAVVCPVTVWELNHAIEAIGSDADAVTIQFVTLDPERDTPAALAKYFSSFDGRIDAYSGARDQIDRLVRAYEVSHRRVDEPGGQYSIDHTATIFLLNARGDVVDVIAYGTPSDVLQTRLRSLLRS